MFSLFPVLIGEHEYLFITGVRSFIINKYVIFIGLFSLCVPGHMLGIGAVKMQRACLLPL